MKHLLVVISVLLLCLCQARITPAAGGGELSAAIAEDTRLDINAATAEQFQVLPGIGPVIAARIVEHRLTMGPFARVDDLLGVAGIGPARLDELRPLLKAEQRQ